MRKKADLVSPEKANVFLTYGGIFFVSLATLTYQVSLMRIFSIAQGYHFAFMLISIGLLGLGASGSFLTVFPSLVKKELKTTIFITTLTFSAVSLIS